MRNQMIPTEELEALVCELNHQLDALELKLSATIRREQSILINGKKKELDRVQEQSNELSETLYRYRNTAVKQPSFIIQPEYSV